MYYDTLWWADPRAAVSSSSFRKYPPAAPCHQQGRGGTVCFRTLSASSPPALTSVPLGLFLSPHCLFSVFLPFLKRVPVGTTTLSKGLSCALCWAGWSRLEQAEPRALLTKAALQPPHSQHLATDTWCGDAE